MSQKGYFYVIVFIIIIVITGTFVILKTQPGTSILQQFARTTQMNETQPIKNPPEVPSSMPSRDDDWEINTSVDYYSEYLAHTSCKDFVCLSDTYGLEIFEIPYHLMEGTWEETLKITPRYCGAFGMEGMSSCDYIGYQDFTSKKGAKGYIVYQTKTISGLEYKDPKILSDRSYVFPVNNRDYPAVMFFLDIPTSEKLSFLDSVADSFSLIDY